jgi:hypothetical protein
MANQYLLHLPDGTEYGPVDRATLEAWSHEGRLPAETLVWPEGAPEWLALEKALATAAPATAAVTAPATAPATAAAAPAAKAPASARPAAAPASASARPASAPLPEPAHDRPETVPSLRISALDGKALHGARQKRGGPVPAIPRAVVLAAVGVAVVVAVLAGLWAVLRPYVARRRAIAEVQRHALADRRVEVPGLGLVVELPTGWVALRADQPFFSRPGSRLGLAQPAARLFGALSVASRPRQMDNLDAHLDELLQERLPHVPSQKERGRSDVQLGKGRGRLVRTTWDDDLAPMQGATVAWADGYDLFSLDAWAPATSGDAFASEVDALCRGIATTGQVAGRIDEGVERLAVEVPELSRDALRLLVAERMSEGRGLDDVPSAALRAVSRGLDALAVAEADEMRTIYQQVWAPVPEAERVRLASLMNAIKAGRPVGADDLLALRTAVKTGVLALPEDQRARLQELSGRAVRQSLLLP